MGTIASQITSLTTVYSTVQTQIKERQSTASLAFVWGIHRRPVNSPHKWPVTWKMFPFEDVIMSQRANNWESVPMPWRHHQFIGCSSFIFMYTCANWWVEIWLIGESRSGLNYSYISANKLVNWSLKKDSTLSDFIYFVADWALTGNLQQVQGYLGRRKDKGSP